MLEVCSSVAIPQPVRTSLGALFLAGALGLCPARAAAEGPPQLDPRRLFSEGVLSPGYPARHARSTARPLSLADEGGGTILSLQFNPALFAFGVWSARAELAPVPYVSLLGEYSRINNFEVPGFKGNLRLDGNVLDLGLHFWPLGEGLQGPYLGPRYSFGSGKDQEGLGEGDLSGWGADLGYQWVAGVFAFNLGAGLGQATARVRPSEELRGRDEIPEELRQAEASATFLRPYLTVGMGLAF